MSNAHTTAGNAYSAAPLALPDAGERKPYTLFDLKLASPIIGAYISGVDLSKPLSDAAFDEIDRALAEHTVIFFRDQTLTPEQHIALAERFGEIDVNRFFKPDDRYPQIAEVRKEAGHKANIGGGWHTDHSYDQIPAKASLLYARELPPVGGDTIYVNAIAAYEALSPGLQRTLGGLKAVHSSRHVFGANSRALAESDLQGRVLNPELATQDAVHPVVFTHPRTGKKALFVNPGFTVRFDGWTEAESAGLLAFLYEHHKRPEFAHRFQWKPGSLAIWDNRTTWHVAVNDYAGQRRLLHRITVKGAALN